MSGVLTECLLAGARLNDVAFSPLKERRLNETKAEITYRHHQEKGDKRPKTRQIEIRDVHDLLIDEPGSVQNDKEVEQIDGI